ncbi:helix-turn-helix transcriptional regulator [Novosphingobium sp. SL115]|uniref:helix-turn-helix domain-containing protein n=1 Tax=Novosphingobium sp. SL115 TaxID=2995150 RepID=UPI0022735485|nr:helix-turn-helix transcriptional regulator [Novosphingobium sp. SL115]MCY1670778.1 helix-turn-helix transcriptional regulator [Novosphingobium sp. SL115]
MAFDEPVLKSVGDLSEKQREVLDLILDRRTNKEIAQILGVSASAVEQRLQSVRRRLGVTSRADLARTYAVLLEACQVCAGEQLQVAIKGVPVHAIPNESGGFAAIGSEVIGGDRAENVDVGSNDRPYAGQSHAVRAVERYLVSRLVVRWIDKVAGLPGRIAAVTTIAAALAHIIATVSILKSDN